MSALEQLGAREWLSEPWRSAREREQESLLPGGRVLVSCSAPVGQGGLGRHLQEILDALRRRGEQPVCISPSLPWPAAAPARGALRRELSARLLAVAAAAPARVSPAWRAWRACASFDLRAAARLPTADHLIAFNGQALAQIRAAPRGPGASTSLASATAHIRHVARQHELALRRHPIERSWATRVVRRNLLEYAAADRVYVSTRYAWDSFVQEGVAPERLTLFPLTPARRFAPGPRTREADTFDVVYVGGLSVVKGVALLVEAIGRLPHSDLRLLLVGGWETSGMRRFLERARARDPRIHVCPGDPLERLRGARLYVHPAYTDGFGYAPAEALAVGVPALVSEHTGMKELIEQGRNGAVLPTGDLEAFAEAIDAAYRGSLFVG